MIKSSGRSGIHVVTISVAVVATVAALGFGYAWWSLKQSQEVEAKDDPAMEIKRQIATVKYNMESLERERVELDEQLKDLPDIQALQLRAEALRERTRALPSAAELRRESVGIKADGSHVQTGEIPPTVRRRMSEELGLSDAEVRRLNGQ